MKRNTALSRWWSAENWPDNGWMLSGKKHFPAVVDLFSSRRLEVYESNELYLLLPFTDSIHNFHHGPLIRYAKLQGAHAPGMPGTFSPPPRVSDPDMHHGPCVTHVPWCMSGSLNSGFPHSQWRGKHFRHSQRMRNIPFFVSGNRSIVWQQWHMGWTRLDWPIPSNAILC